MNCQGKSLIIIAALYCAACARDSRSGTVVVRDSLGVSIVEHRRIAEDVPALRLDETPSVQIGVTDGPEQYQFFQVVDALRRADGSIVVIDRSRTMRAYDSSGVHLWTAGRPGQGPGEFSYAQRLSQLPGDTLAVWDPGPGRLTLFNAAGEFVRAWTPPDMAASAVLLGLADSTRLLLDKRRLERGVISGHKAITVNSELHLLNVRETSVVNLGRRLNSIQFQEVDDNGAFSYAIFGTPAVFAPARNGFWYGDAQSNQLQRSTVEGSSTILRWPGTLESVRDDDVKALLNKWTSAPDATAESRKFLTEYVRTQPRAEHFPSYEEIQTDAAGRLWVRDFVREHADDGVRRWLVFSSDGQRVIARLTHAAKLKPLRVDMDGILGVERDEFGVERIVYRRVLR